MNDRAYHNILVKKLYIYNLINNCTDCQNSIFVLYNRRCLNTVWVPVQVINILYENYIVFYF